MMMARAHLKILISSLLALSLTSASALTLEGTLNPKTPSGMRVGLFTLGPSGKPALEVVSSAFRDGKFSLLLPNTPLEARFLGQLTPDAVSWSGVVGVIKVTGTPKFGELRFFSYFDTNSNAKRDSGETLSETLAQLGRSSLVLLYLDGPSKVNADKGFEVSLKAGWNALSIEAGRTVKGTVLERINNLELNAL